MTLAFRLSFSLLFLCAFTSNLSAQLCYANPQGTAGVCIDDTVTFTSNGINCTTCSFQWTPSGLGVTLVGGGKPGSPTASYTFDHSSSLPVTYITVGCTYTDTVGTFCTGGSTYDHWDISVLGKLQMPTLNLLNGPLTGDTNKVWIYERIGVGVAHYDYTARSYSVTGGNVVAVAMDNYTYAPVPVDTLYIQWNNTGSRQLHCGAPYINYSQSLSNPWPQICSNYTETIPPEPVPDPYPVGPDTVCLGDTFSYYITPLPGATYTWSVAGGTLLAGQGTDQVQIVWTSLPGSITATRTVGGASSTETLNVTAGATPTNLFPPDTIYCAGAPSIVLDAGPGASYAWSTGATTQSIAVNDSGAYAVTVTGAGICAGANFSDTIEVVRRVPVVPDLGPDRTFCKDTSQVWTLGPGFAAASWNGSFLSNLTYSTTQGGPLAVLTTDTNGCTAADTVHLTAILPPTINLPPVANHCDGDSLLLNAGNPTASFLWSNGSTFQATFVQGPGPFTVEVNYQGCVRFDTTLVSVLPTPAVALASDTALCSGDSTLLDAGQPGSSFLWSTGATTQTIWASGPAVVSVEVTNGAGCTGRDTVNLVELTDCVWPGDVNLDGVADHVDVLALGTVIGQTGPVRANANLNWEGQPATDWAGSIGGGANAKHADTDGNGLANPDDTLAIQLNFGLTHNKTGGIQTGVPVFLAAEMDSLPAGDVAYFQLHVGDAAVAADSVYGLAFTLRYDSTLIDADGVLSMEWGNSWLAPTADQLHFGYEQVALARMDAALVRTNGLDTSGAGPVVRIGLRTVGDLTGKTHLLAKTLQVELSDVHLVDHDLADIGTMVSGDSVVVFEEALAVGERQPIEWQIYPNPVRDRVRLETVDVALEGWKVFNHHGQVVEDRSVSPRRQAELSTADWAEGIYFVQLITDRGATSVAKLAVIR